MEVYMRRPRFEARVSFRVLAVVLLLLAAVSTALPLASPAAAAAKGTVRFQFKEPFLDFAILFGTANVAGPGWVVPEKYYKQVGADGFKQKPIGAGPYKLVRHEPGVKVEMEAFDGYYRPVHVKQLVMTSVPEAATRVAMLERGEADIIYNVPGELINKVGKLPGVTLAPVLSGSFFLELPNFQDPKNPFRDKRVREAVDRAMDSR